MSDIDRGRLFTASCVAVAGVDAALARRLDPMAKRHDVRIAVHNHSDVRGEHDFDAILKGLPDRMAINLDIGSGGGSPPTSNGKSTAIGSRPCASASTTAGRFLNRKRVMRKKENVMQNCPRSRHSCALFRLTAAVLLSVALPWAAAAQQDAGTLRVLVQDSTGEIGRAHV